VDMMVECAGIAGEDLTLQADPGDVYEPGGLLSGEPAF